MSVRIQWVRKASLMMEGQYERSECRTQPASGSKRVQPSGTGAKGDGSDRFFLIKVK